MKIPNGDTAIVDIKKLEDYCLNISHPMGKHKAKVFRTSINLTAIDANELKSAILNAAVSYDAIPGEEDMYGKRYTIDFIFSKFDKKVEIRSSWIIRSDENFPHFITCYVKPKHGALHDK